MIIIIISISTESHPNSRGKTLQFHGRPPNTPLPTRRFHPPIPIPNPHMDAKPNAIHLLLLLSPPRIHPMVSRIPLPRHPGRTPIHHAQARTFCLSRPLSKKPQTPSSLHQSAPLRYLQWFHGEYHPHDPHPFVCNCELSPRLQCVDVHGLWEHVRQLARFDSFRGILSVGSRV